MPRATRNRVSHPAPAVVEEEQEDEDDGEQEEAAEDMDVDGNDEDLNNQDGGSTLQNDEPLNWKAGKPIPVALLLQRLKALAEELRGCEQGELDRSSLTVKAKELANAQLLSHKDYGVRVYTLQCNVEMLRLMAPDAPYKASQIKDMFRFIISTVVPAVADPGHTYNGVHLAMLTSLATVKSILLVQDLPGSDGLLKDLFLNCFDVMAGNVRDDSKEMLSKNVEHTFTSILCALVDETALIPAEVIEIILAQFLRADPHATTGKQGEEVLSQVLKEVSPAYNMARSVCNSCEDKMVRHVGQYFNSVLLDASQVSATTKPTKSRGKKRSHDASEDEDDSGLLAAPSEDDLAEAAKAHRLLRELWRSCPAVVQNVVPQVEAEANAENVTLRVMAVQSMGDMISGIGAAGPPPPVALGPAAYPSQSLDSFVAPPQQNILLVPAAPQAFSSAYPSAYQTFLDRHRDKMAQVRSAWATAVGRVVSTSAGGIGLDPDQEKTLLRYFADLMQDTDEKVRLATVNALSRFDFYSIVHKLGKSGGVGEDGSILNNLCSKFPRDTKISIAAPAIELAGRIWGVASGAIVEGDERTRELLGQIPSNIFGAMYINNKVLNMAIQRTMWESLLPVGFPPIKSRKDGNADSQRVPDSQSSQEKAPDSDKIRVERILTLIRDLEERPRTALFAILQNQVARVKYLEKILDLSETLGSDGKNKGSKELLQQRQKLIGTNTQAFPDAKLAEEHFTKYFEHYDRRNYVLARFCVDSKNEYKKVSNALKEIIKRLEASPSQILATRESIVPFLLSTAALVYNRSHIPAIVEISRSDEHGLSAAAHTLLKEISVKAPLIFEVHVKDLCETLKKQAPSATSTVDPFASDTLKACAGFARQFPYKMPKDREFYQAMVKFAKHGSPPTVAKHAVTVICASAEKKDMYISDILKFCLKAFEVDAEGFLSKLAAIGQLRLLAYRQTEDYDAEIKEVLSSCLVPRPTADKASSEWTSEVDDGLNSNLWALTAFVNQVRGQIGSNHAEELPQELSATAGQVFKVLNTIIECEGKLSSKSKSPEHHRSRLRLHAAKLILKLCCYRSLDRIFTPVDFNRLTKIAQDPLPEVRRSFNNTLRKYIGQGRLTRRFYCLLFLYAFEPLKVVKDSTITFLRARATNFTKNGDTLMESVFAYLLSLLAHHQDFTPAATDLGDFIDYIIFYLKIVATEKNLPAIYAIAQRAKTVQDAVEPENSVNLWTLSDLAEGIIRQYEQLKGWSLQILPVKPSMPKYLYKPIQDREMMHQVAEKRFLPDEIAEELEDLVRERMKSKKRKAVDGNKRAAKRARPSTTEEKRQLPVRRKKEVKGSKPTKTPKNKAADHAPSSERRKSNRVSTAKTYAEDSESDEEEIDVPEADESSEADEEKDQEANKENVSSTPPSSEPAPAQAEETEEPPKAGRKTAKSSAKESQMAAAARKALPARGGRATRGAQKKERDVFDVPDDDSEMGDA